MGWRDGLRFSFFCLCEAECSLTLLRGEEKRRRRCPCAGPDGSDGIDIDLIYALVSTPLWGNPQMEVLCQYECSDIVEIKFFQLESLILAQNERWRQA